MNVIGCQTLIDIVQHKVDDLQQIVLAERLEFDNAVKAVHKLRTEEVAQFTQDGVGAALHLLLQSQRWLRLPVPALDVMMIMGVFRADSPALAIGQAAII